MIEAHEATGGPAFELYALGLEHKHLPGDAAYARLPAADLRALGRAFRQGMLVSVPLHLDTLPGRPSIADLHEALAAHYHGARWCACCRPRPGDGWSRTR